MTLQERAFMVNIINANYRRRMINFWLNIFVLLSPVAIVIYFEESITSTQIIIVAMVMCAAIWRIIIVYFQDDGYYSLPWQTKKRQVIALNENEDAPFDEMRSSVPLQEYFFI